MSDWPSPANLPPAGELETLFSNLEELEARVGQLVGRMERLENLIAEVKELLEATRK